MFDFTSLSVAAVTETEKKAANFFAEEITLRTGKTPQISGAVSAPAVIFKESAVMENKDCYDLALADGVLTVTAQGIRGLIFGYSYFLRKTVYENGKTTLLKDISGQYRPEKRIRGHQLGYRQTPNSYDAWDVQDYHRYLRDMMFFGVNIFENMPDTDPPEDKNRLMKYSSDEMTILTSKLADELDMDFSIWFPNDEQDIPRSLERRRDIFEKIPRLDVVFPPGGDPGDFDADEFAERVIAISKLMKEIHPNAEMWPSAQKPHGFPEWGNVFIEEMEKLPDEIDGVIQGPNRAFTIDKLRRRLPMKYPLRLYPDITHNVRCEYPVHWPADDWHYALASCLSRECVNPRPVEFRRAHRLTRRYVEGSVSYSEGVTDDVNKFVWSDMDFFGEVPLRETLEDYGRVFFPGADYVKVADALFGLEMNWYGDPAENTQIENTLKIFDDLYAAQPSIIENWRFGQLYFRAKCDAIVRRRRLFELQLIEGASYCIRKNDVKKAAEILNTDYPADYKALRGDLFPMAEKLHEQIGLQLDVEHFCAKSWERGAVLDVIDLPVTDKKWLLNRMEYSKGMGEAGQAEFMNQVLDRNDVGDDGYYFSMSEHGFELTGVPLQDGDDIYVNFLGDRKEHNNGSMPMCSTKIFDNMTFKCKLGGFTPGVDYKLKICYRSGQSPIALNHHYIKANGETIYDGMQFGGEKDPEFDKALLPPGFETAAYTLPASVFQNGCVELLFGQPIMGVIFNEFWITRA